MASGSFFEVIILAPPSGFVVKSYLELIKLLLEMMLFASSSFSETDPPAPTPPALSTLSFWLKSIDEHGLPKLTLAEAATILFL